MKALPNILTSLRLVLTLFVFLALATAAGAVPYVSEQLTPETQFALQRWAFWSFVIAAVTVAAPVVLYLVAPGKAADVLDEVRAWLVANNAAIMGVLLLVIGTQLLGKGIGSF